MFEFSKKAMIGLAAIGSSSMENVAFILVGRYDLELKCAFYVSYMKKNAEKIEDIEIPEVLESLECLKNLYRRDIKAIFDQAAELDKVDLIARLKESNKPHEMGTVSEVAAKYGISKSEVRRRKLDGTLSLLK